MAHRNQVIIRLNVLNLEGVGIMQQSFTAYLNVLE